MNGDLSSAGFAAGSPADAAATSGRPSVDALLEALWVARELDPTKAVAFSEDAHYTHARMAAVLRMDAVPVAADAVGRMDLDALEDALKTGRIGTVVLTLLVLLGPVRRATHLKPGDALRYA